MADESPDCDGSLKKTILSGYAEIQGERCLPALCGPWGRFMPLDESSPPLPWFNSITDRQLQFTDETIN